MRIAILLGAFAFLQVARVAWAKPETPDVASGQNKTHAQQAYLRAMEDFEGGRFDEALAGFRRSYEIVQSPNSRFMIGRTLARLGRNAEAYTELELTIQEAEVLGGRYTAAAQAAQAKLEEIRPRIGKLYVDASKLPKGSRIDVEEHSLDREEIHGAVPVLPGEVTVFATLPSGEKIAKKVKVEAGGEAVAELAPPPKKAKAPPEPIAFVEKDAHGVHSLEVEAHWMFTTLEPPGPPNQGFGPGLRFTLELLPTGIFDGLNDGLGVSTGVDWVVTSVPDHFWLPVVAQYGVWVARDLSLFLEPGVALKFVDETAIVPVVQVGGRYVIRQKWAIVLRAGVPAASAGASLLF